MVKNRLSGQKGQTTIEYVLLMFVIMITIVATLYAFSQSAKNFIANYWGDYFQCLLETGELPSLGSQTDNNGSCNDSFQPFTFTNGRPPINNVDQGYVNTAGNVPPSSAPIGTGTGAAAENHSNDLASGDGAGGMGGSKVDLTNGEKAQETQSGSQFNKFARNGGDEEESDDQKKYVPTGIYLKGNHDDKDHKSVVASLGKAEEEKLKPRRVPATINKNPQVNTGADTSMTLPDILRYLLIIGIVLAIVIFFGNQIMQFQKSKE